MNTTPKDDTMTTLTAEPDVSALDVLRAGGCTPSCLLGQETGRCGCRCGGSHHGILLNVLTRQAETSARPSRAEHRRRRKGRKA
jgi:hypothetical protein